MPMWASRSGSASWWPAQSPLADWPLAWKRSCVLCARSPLVLLLAAIARPPNHLSGVRPIAARSRDALCRASPGRATSGRRQWSRLSCTVGMLTSTLEILYLCTVPYSYSVVLLLMLLLLRAIPTYRYDLLWTFEQIAFRRALRYPLGVSHGVATSCGRCRRPVLIGSAWVSQSSMPSTLLS